MLDHRPDDHPISLRQADPVAGAVAIARLRRSYPNGHGVHDVTLAAQAGAITAILGPNGAGKTTTIECAVGLRQPQSGCVRVLGRDPAHATAQHRAAVGVMLQDGGLPMGARAQDLLRHLGRLHRNPWPLPDLIERLELHNCARSSIRRLSGGERQRVALAAALSGRPRVLFVDEPTAGLDPAARHRVWALLQEVRATGTAIVLSTHLLDEVERLADQVYVLHQGHVLTHGSPAELTAGGADTGKFQARSGLDLRGLRGALPEAVTIRENHPGQYLLEGAIGPQALATLTAWCASHDVMPQGLIVGHRSLEDVFLELTGLPLGGENRD